MRLKFANADKLAFLVSQTRCLQSRGFRDHFMLEIRSGSCPPKLESHQCPLPVRLDEMPSSKASDDGDVAFHEAFASRWNHLVLTFDEQIDLWQEIIAELRNGAWPSTTSSNDIDVLFWKFVRNVLSEPRIAEPSSKPPTKSSFLRGDEERKLEKKVMQNLDGEKKFFQALAKANPDFYWEWKLTNGLVLDIMGKAIEPTLSNENEKQSQHDTVAVGDEVYRLTGQPVIDYLICDYPALYVKWLSLMKCLQEEIMDQMCEDKLISNAESRMVDVCVYDVQFTLTNATEDAQRIDTLLGKSGQNVSTRLRKSGHSDRRSWSQYSLAFKVLKAHGTIQKVILEETEEISKIKSWLRDPDSKLLVESEEVSLPEQMKTFDDLFDL
uniref:DNA-directed DNA polymerase n=1 Tax=Steinernema glaseri TaxID=37863 RepID=A0A1I8AJ05_9BILA